MTCVRAQEEAIQTEEERQKSRQQMMSVCAKGDTNQAEEQFQNIESTRRL